jgi:tellurite resistance protein TehA-like permease
MASTAYTQSGSVKLLMKELDPGYFAMVMGTGVISIASYFLGYTAIAWVLLVITVIAYILLLTLTFGRFFWYRTHALADLGNHMRGTGFLTTVAATCILGNQFVIIVKVPVVALILWIFGVALWLILFYTFIALMVVRSTKPALQDGINGGWLIIVVSTQAISTLGTLVLPYFVQSADVALFFSLVLYLMGGILYILIMGMIFYRLMFFTVSAQQFTPPYWINLGAAAITTLAGSTLILNAGKWSFLQEILPFLKGFTLFYWAAATWWIPLLFILGFWRHFVKHVPFKYDPSYWRLVFPLGVYTTSTFQFAKGSGLSFLFVIPQISIFVALFAWVVVFGGLCMQILSQYRQSAASTVSDKI